MRSYLPASQFGMILGLCGLGQAWRAGAALWGLPSFAGEAVLGFAGLVWCALVARTLWQLLRAPAAVRAEFNHPLQGAAPALIAVSTMLLAIAAQPRCAGVAAVLAVAGVALHLAMALWHTGRLWRGGGDVQGVATPMYFPTVAGNLVCAAMLGVMGAPEWGWLFFGAGVLSWLALESLVIQRLWQSALIVPAQRPLLGVQFAPPIVCAMAWMALAPPFGPDLRVTLMLLGYGFFQLLVLVRLAPWFREQAFVPAYWAFTFGTGAAALCVVRLAVAGAEVARVLALPVFIAANVFIGVLVVRTFYLLVKGRLLTPL